MKKNLITLILVLTLSGCMNQNKSLSIKEIMKNNNYIIIDVRTKEEYDKKHIKGAINIPYNQLNNELDKNKIIFVYCQTGTRSKIAFEKLTNLGYTVYDLGTLNNIDLPQEN